jgi:hypothetical protein
MNNKRSKTRKYQKVTSLFHEDYVFLKPGPYYWLFSVPHFAGASDVEVNSTRISETSDGNPYLHSLRNTL